MPRLTPTNVARVSQMGGPRLWNAKQRIKVSRALHPEYIKELEKDPFSERWRKFVSQDVVKFVDDLEGRDRAGQPVNEMLPEEKIQLLKSPARYFSRPHHVPPKLRNQVYFPDFAVTLLRTPHLGPQFAAFEVPLWFGKLDIKSYLQNLYNVDVSHVRSFVIYQQAARRPVTNRYQRGQQYLPPYKKKMTVQLVEPFIYPPELTKKELNNPGFEKDRYWRSTINFYETARTDQAEFPSKPNLKHRRSIAEQAKAILERKEQWQPTWKHLTTDVRVLEGRVGRHTLPDPSQPPQILQSDTPSLSR